MRMRKIWEVDFNIIGPLTLEREVQFKQEKGFDHQQQFYSDINLKPTSSGFKATITAYADSLETAETVAYVYFGRMRDVLSLNNDIPIQLNTNEGWFNNRKNFTSRRRLTKSDVIIAFKMARHFEIEHPKLLRSIGWYSKGKLSYNTFDQFTAFWNVIEIISKEYHTTTSRTSRGIKNQIYQCFIDNFGEIRSWDLPEDWIDDMYDKRNVIYHGGQDITLDTIKDTSKLIPLLEKTSKELIDKIISANYHENDFEYLVF